MFLLCTAVEEGASIQSRRSIHIERAANDVSARDAQEPSTANFVRLQEVCCLLCIAHAISLFPEWFKLTSAPSATAASGQGPSN